MSLNQKFLMKQYEHLKKSDLGMIVSFKDNSLYQWRIQFTGLKNTKHQSQKFNLSIKFPAQYPFVRPILKFIDYVPLHDFIDKNGQLCLQKNEWTAALTAYQLCLHVIWLLGQQNNKYASKNALMKNSNANKIMQINQLKPLNCSTVSNDNSNKGNQVNEIDKMNSTKTISDDQYKQFQKLKKQKSQGLSKIKHIKKFVGNVATANSRQAHQIYKNQSVPLIGEYNRQTFKTLIDLDVPVWVKQQSFLLLAIYALIKMGDSNVWVQSTNYGKKQNKHFPSLFKQQAKCVKKQFIQSTYLNKLSLPFSIISINANQIIENDL